MKVYRETHHKSRLSNEQLLDMVDAVCPAHNSAFILCESTISSCNIEKVGKFAVKIKYSTYVFYKLPERNEMYGFATNEMYGFATNGAYAVLRRINGSSDYVLCSIMPSTSFIAPDEYICIGEL